VTVPFPLIFVCALEFIAIKNRLNAVSKIDFFIVLIFR